MPNVARAIETLTEIGELVPKVGAKIHLDQGVIGGVEGAADSLSPFRLAPPSPDISAQRLQQLQGFFAGQPEVQSRLSALGDSGLKTKHLVDFIKSSPEARVPLVSAELTNGATQRQLGDRYHLPGLERTLKHLPPESQTMQTARQFERQHRLNFFQLGMYLDENPAPRLDMVTEALKNGSPERVRDLIRLSVFPEEVASRLALAGSTNMVQSAAIAHYARDLESGQRFVQFLTEHTEKGGEITAAKVEEINANASSSQIKVDTDKTRSEPAGWDLRLDNDRSVTELARDLNETANIITDKFAPDQTLVLLWRDMGPLAAPLHARGRHVINFHWSRAQWRDPGTFDRWMREVPPNAVAIDAGLGGSILDSIRAVDASAQGHLLESAGKYPQILPGTAVLQIADDLEAYPKLVGRCTGFWKGRSSMCRLRNEDEQDFFAPSLNAVPWNQALLGDMGLSRWHVWRFKTFTAVPQSERVGISKPERIRDYLRRVSYQRDD